MPKQTFPKMTKEEREQFEHLCAEVERFNRKGLHQTVHHDLLAKMEVKFFGKVKLASMGAEHYAAPETETDGLIPPRKIEEPTDEVNDGQ